MTDHAWKAFERRIAKKTGGQRRGADYGDREGGKNDIIHDAFSIECKLLARPSYQQMLDACRQSEAAATSAQMPVAIVKRKRDRDDDTLVIMRLEEWERWFV